jgi:hypothetical protein
LANNHVIATISGHIYGVAAYYSENDATQHVVAATDDGTLYEIHWNRNTPYTSPQWLVQIPVIGGEVTGYARIKNQIGGNQA